MQTNIERIEYKVSGEHREKTTLPRGERYILNGGAPTLSYIDTRVSDERAPPIAQQRATHVIEGGSLLALVS